MRVVSFIGASEAGKTTLIERLIRHLAATTSVAAIKHTHHPLEQTNRGDTLRFQQAGAREVILAADCEAVLWRGSRPHPVRFREPAELLGLLDAEWVLIEGFKGHHLGPAIVVGDLEPPRHAVALVRPRGGAETLPVFTPSQVAELAEFLGRITGS